MVMRGGSRAALVLVVVLAVAAGPAFGTKQDGLPRPTGYPDIPTKAYGPLPPCYNTSGAAVTCEWYGFSHILYPISGAECNAGMRAALSNTTLFGPGDLKPYTYYFSPYYVFDPTTNATYCLYGCFDLSDSSAAAPPPGYVAAPPPVALNPPPPVARNPPPPALSSPPPPAVSAPPPVRSSNPPPAALFTPPPASVTTPAGTTPAPAVPGTRVINLNGAGFLRPTGFVSFVLSGALLILNGLAAF